MLTESKNTKLFCMADDFCKFFDTMVDIYTLKSDNWWRYYRDSTLSKAEIKASYGVSCRPFKEYMWMFREYMVIFLKHLGVFFLAE